MRLPAHTLRLVQDRLDSVVAATYGQEWPLSWMSQADLGESDDLPPTAEHTILTAPLDCYEEVRTTA